MNSYEQLDLIASQRHLILDTWNFFISTHFAIIAAILYFQRKLSIVERLYVVVPYLLFMLLNYSGQIKNYIYLSELSRGVAEYDVMKSYVTEPSNIFRVTDGVVLHLPLNWVLFVYLTAGLLTLVLVLVINPLADDGRHQKWEHPLTKPE